MVIWVALPAYLCVCQPSIVREGLEKRPFPSDWAFLLRAQDIAWQAAMGWIGDSTEFRVKQITKRINILWWYWADFVLYCIGSANAMPTWALFWSKRPKNARNSPEIWTFPTLENRVKKPITPWSSQILKASAHRLITVLQIWYAKWCTKQWVTYYCVHYCMADTAQRTWTKQMS